MADQWRRVGGRLVMVLPYVAIAVGAGLAFWWLVSAQEPRVFFDSAVFVETARQPWSWAQVFYPKPPFVPLVYRMTGTDEGTIVTVQAVLCAVSWGVLGGALAVTLERRWARIAAVAIAALFVLAPTRIGFTHAVLSESINDSLQALAVAAAVLLVGRVGRAKLLAGVLLLVAIAWMWTRDTNAVVVLVAVPIVVVARRRTLGRARWALAIAALAVVNAACVLWSTTVIPPPTGLTVHAYWPADFTARKTFPTFNNVSDLLRDPEAVRYFEAHGLPQSAELQTLGDEDKHVYLDPKYTPARVWIVEHASRTYLTWLLRHPIDRALQIAAHPWAFFGVYRMHHYMPTGWERSGLLTQWTRGLTENKVIIALLLLACPFVLWRSTQHPLAFLALVLIVSGLVGGVASFYGDSLERSRHCYAAGQQVIFGLVLAVLARFAARRVAAAQTSKA